MKVADLQGTDLDVWAAHAAGEENPQISHPGGSCYVKNAHTISSFRPSAEWRRMMDDRKLTELAARAAGYTPDGWYRPMDADHDALSALDNDGAFEFAPLHDDGDVFRLAVALGISFKLTSIRAIAKKADIKCRERLGNDPLAAARRAIVRAAAAIGAANDNA